MATATKSAPKAAKSTGTLKLRPLNDKILVRRDEAEEKTSSGIYLPEQAKDKPKTGVVEAVGDGALNPKTGQRIALTVKKGDRVVFSAYAGSEVKIDGNELLIMSEDEVLAILD